LAGAAKLEIAMEKPRVVFDCMIFLQALISPKSVAFKLFEYLEVNRFTLFISREILAEVKNVLNRDYIRNSNPQITDEAVETFLEEVLQKAVLIKTVPPKFKYSRDPKDEKYINLAIEAEADFLVSRDKDLLDLMTDVSVEGKEFRQKSRPLKIVEPLEFLRILAEKSLS
jgi:uncharacterized protein